MGHRWTRDLALKNTERWSVRSVANMAVFATLMMLKSVRTAGDSVLSEVGKKMERARNRSYRKLDRKGILAEGIRRLWKEHVADYCQASSQCFDCNRISCERCTVLPDSHSEDSRRRFMRLVKPEPSTPEKIIQVRYYKGFGVIEGGKELQPDKRTTHGLCKTPSNLSKRNKG